ncbi:MAG: NUDIX domain-containing protein [Pontibacterium sp.]
MTKVLTQWQPRFDTSAVKVLKREPLSDGFLKLNAYDIEHACFDRAPIQVKRELLERGRAVAVLMYDPHLDAVVLVEQFRIGALSEPKGPWLLELVAGIAEEGETSEEVAHREVQEEAGATLLSLMPITQYMVSPGGVQESIELFFARVDAQGLGGVHGLESEGEDIAVHVIDRNAALAMVVNGEINNASTIIALQWLALNHANMPPC